MRATILAAVFVVTLTPAALAQLALAPPPQPQAPIGTAGPPPAFEFGGHVDYLSLVGGEAVLGARFARRRADWLFTELAYDTNVDPKHGQRSFDKFRVFMANVRLQTPRDKNGDRAFFTAGLAAAKGLSYAWSPMVGVGLQREVAIGAGLGALRGELQFFSRASKDEVPGRLQLLVGFTVSVP